MPLPINTVVQFSTGRRRYVIVRNTKLHGYSIVALSGGDKGSGSSGVHPGTGEGAYGRISLIVDKDQSIEFTGVEADKRRREYEHHFLWRASESGRLDRGAHDAKPYVGLAYKQVGGAPRATTGATPTGATRPAGRRGPLAPGERKASWESSAYGVVNIIEGAQGRSDVWHNIAASKGRRENGAIGAVRYGWNGQRWSKHTTPPDALKDEVIEHGWGALFGWGDGAGPEGGEPEESGEPETPEEEEAREASYESEVERTEETEGHTPYRGSTGEPVEAQAAPTPAPAAPAPVPVATPTPTLGSMAHMVPKEKVSPLLHTLDEFVRLNIVEREDWTGGKAGKETSDFASEKTAQVERAKAQAAHPGVNWVVLAPQGRGKQKTRWIVVGWRPMSDRLSHTATPRSRSTCRRRIRIIWSGLPRGSLAQRWNHYLYSSDQ